VNVAIGSGLAASIGVAPEVTFGTYVAPTRFHEFTSETLGKSKNTVQGGGLAGGRYGRLGSRRVLTNQAASGSVQLEVANRQMGLLFAHLMGSSTAPVQQGATAAYLQTHAIGDNVGKSLSIQKGVPDLGGTVRPYTFKGCKVTAAEFACEVDGFLSVGLEIDGREASEAEVLAAPSYPTGLAPFHFGQMSVKLGTVGAEASVTGIRGVSLRIERPMATDRYYAGGAGLKAEPLSNDFPVVTGTFTTDYTDKTTFADRFANDGSTSLVWEFLGPTIAGANVETFRLRVPMIFINDGTPQVGGPGLVQPSFTFEGQLNGTNPLTTIEYMSIDTAL
jgi:Phage tail tube protein